MAVEKFCDIEEPAEKVKPSIKNLEPYAFSRLNNREWRREVLERVDQLIDQIKKNDIQELIFLDKSARPLSWLLRNRWEHIDKKSKPPKIKYIDLGLRERKGDQLGEETVIEQISKEADALYESIDKDKRERYCDDNDWAIWKKNSFAQGEDVDGEIWMSRKHISKLYQDVVKRHPKLVEQIRTRYGDKLGKTLIIDDLLFSGGTLRAAVAIFTEAYPEADVFGVHFFNQNAKRPQTQIPWFKNQRMVGVQEDEESLTTKKFSAYESKKPDLSKELREILKEVAEFNQKE